jgi:hypothetical protein
MATTRHNPTEISLRGFIEAVGSADAPHGAVSTAAVAGGLGVRFSWGSRHCLRRGQTPLRIGRS